MQEGVLLVADVHKHGLETGFDILDSALEDAAHDVVFAFTLNAVFLQHAVLEQSYAAFQFF